MTAELLSLTDVHAYYGESHILHGVDLSVKKGEVVALLGRNGSGRTTLLKSIMGLVDKRKGSIRIGGQECASLPPHRIARMGIGCCPEERGIFSGLSCEENLMLPPMIKEGGLSVAELYEIFPNIKERRASPGTRLSGGEQQMLALARIMRSGAHLLLLDEISEGLAPVIVQALGRTIRLLREKGYTILMVEQNFRFAAPLADQFHIVEHGRIVSSFAAAELSSHMGLLHEYLGV